DRQLSRLNQLIDNLLDIATSMEGNILLNLEDVDLAEVVRNAVERVRDAIIAAGSRLAIDLEGPGVGRWGRHRLEQVVVNLLINAGRYGLGNPVRVKLQRRPQMARISVEDRGMGIPERDLERVFDRFTRVGPGREVAGLGIGLHISRAIVEA